ncbi:hypothetical protein Tco_1426617 [Tanacetum coccineum]
MRTRLLDYGFCYNKIPMYCDYVGIKSLLNAASITAAHIRVNAAQLYNATRMRTRSTGRPVAESRGGGTVNGLVEVEGVEDPGENLLPVMLAQVGNQGNVGNQNGNVVIENEYDGKGGAIVISQWIKKMESVQDMSGYSIDQKVKYTASSFVGKALMWWNSQIRTLSREVVVSMTWKDYKFMMIEEFCPSHEMQKLETDLCNNAMVMAGHAAYTDRYVYDLALQIRMMVAATEPKTTQKVVQIFDALTDEAVRNGSIKKVEKRGNMGEPSKDRNGRDD